MKTGEMKTLDIANEFKDRSGLKFIITSDLVEELKYREGVEFIMVTLEDRCEVAVDNEYDINIYSARHDGPEIVLRITD